MNTENIKLKDMLPAMEEVMPSEEDLLDADEYIGILTLVQGELEDGQPFYAYLSIPPSQYMDFKVAEEEGNYQLMDYGEILAYRVGESAPSDEMKAKMENEFGANHNLEEDLLNDLQAYMDEEVKDLKEQHKKALLDKYTRSKH